MTSHEKSRLGMLVGAAMCVLGPIAGLAGTTFSSTRLTVVGLVVGALGIVSVALAAYFFLRTATRADSEPESAT